MYLLLWMAGCVDLTVVAREVGVREPVTTPCGDLDPTRCLLPWPSSSFSVVDESTATGLRLAVEPEALAIPDDPSFLNLGDGFSRISGIAAAFDGGLEVGLLSEDPGASLEEGAPVLVFNAQHDHEHYGQRVPVWTEAVDVSTLENERWLVVARPSQVMAAASDHVVVMRDSLGAEAPHVVRVALGLDPPETEVEAALAGYHVPTRALLAEQGIDPETVIRVFDFTTRSASDPHERVYAIQAALDAALGDLEVVIDSVTPRSGGPVLAIVRGRLTGAPGFLDSDGRFELDADGLPQLTGSADVTWRMTLPAGEGDYRLALYGHGTGGDVTDGSFDEELAEYGIAKLNLRFDGWTGEDFLETLVSFGAFLEGSERSTAGLVQSLAGASVLLTAAEGALGDVLSADQLGGEPNLAAGRRPITDEAVWIGGSMGGTMGAVITSAEPRISTAVLNVPGAAWTHMIPASFMYESGLGAMLLSTYSDPLDLQLAVIMAQGAWDDVDGAVWAEEALAAGGNFLLQQSMGDTVVPNPATELLASAFDAVQFSPSLEAVYGLEHTDGIVTGGAALEQFRVPDTGVYDVHGFAARSTIAGEAALSQMLGLLESYWAGSPEMAHPELCGLTADGTCDFVEIWED